MGILIKWKALKKVVLVLCTLSSGVLVCSQDGPNEIRQLELQKALSSFGQGKEQIMDNLRGEVYVNMTPQSKGNKFFPNDQWLEGSILSSYFRLEGILLKYDTHQDQLLYLDSRGNKAPVNLDPLQVQSFVLVNSHFMYFSDQDSMPFKGFLEIPYSGKTRLYHKIFSKLQKGTDNPFGQHEIRHRYFVQSGKNIKLIRKKKDLLSILSDQTEKVSEFLKVNKLSVSRMTNEDFIRILSYYESL
ncbi:MAG: hypothetical protein MRZ79_13570 [Bacteroidia bacterium]|nr:hypothetical protein [Bacteroidia bacterium]